MAIVRKLGVREVFSEGLWPEGMDNYQIRLSILKEQAEAQPDLTRKLAEVEGIIRSATGAREEKAVKLKTEIQETRGG